MKVFDLFNLFRASAMTAKPVNFKRGVYRKHHVVGYSPDPNSIHPGFHFRGGITPMRRRVKFSKTAKAGARSK